MMASRPLRTRAHCCLVVLAILLAAGRTPAWASDREAAARVREGVRLHQAGDFEQAAQAFAQAAETLPADPRVAFDQGCALAAQGKHAEAETLLRDAALARDSGLAADAYYNLGCLASDQLKTLFGDQPEQAVDETRESGLLLVRTAVDHFRNALRANPEHAAARRNLELLRIWSKHIQDRWADVDRQRRRDKMNVLEFLAWLQSEQRGVRGLAKALPETLDSPTLRQTARKLSATQRDLTLEIEPLKVKLDNALQPPADPAPPAATAVNPQPAPKPALSPQLQQARAALHGLADEAGQAMSRAADTLAERNVSGAIAAQTEVLPPLNQLFEFLAPFEAILAAAIKSETDLVESSKRAMAGDSSGGTGGSAALDFETLAEDQQFVSEWARMLVRKAEQLLAEAATEPAAGAAPEAAGVTEIPLPTKTTDQSPTPPGDPAVPSDTAAPSEPAVPGKTAAGPPPADAPAATGETVASSPDPQAAYEKAVELGPRITKLTREAAADLQRQAWSTALPKQEESLELLQEIAALLPPQEQQDQDQDQQEKEKQDDQEKQDQEKQDQNKQDQEKQDQEKQQDKSSSDEERKKKQDQDKSDSKQKDDAEKKKEKQQSDQEKSENEQGQPQETLSRQQAESLLRQVRQREREHREFEKEIRRLLQSRIIVEKDW